MIKIIKELLIRKEGLEGGKEQEKERGMERREEGREGEREIKVRKTKGRGR